jgi:hypothetical protein
MKYRAEFPQRLFMKEQACPHCGQPSPPKVEVTGRERRKLVEFLLCRPNGMTRAELANLMWIDDPDGGPDNDLAICQLVHQARLQLLPQGYSIVSNRGPGARYRLVKFDRNGESR